MNSKSIASRLIMTSLALIVSSCDSPSEGISHSTAYSSNDVVYGDLSQSEDSPSISEDIDILVSEDSRDIFNSEVTHADSSESDLNLPVGSDYCFDSDGRNFYKLGTRKGIAFGQPFSDKDQCVTRSKGDKKNGVIPYGYISAESCSGEECFLDEVLCLDEMNAAANRVYCPGGCDKGACLPYEQQESCLEVGDRILFKTDDDQIIGYVSECWKGTESMGLFSSPSNSWIEKYVCDGAFPKKIEEVCSGNGACEDAKCL